MQTWMTLEDACQRLGVSRHTMAKWRARGVAPKFKKLPNGSLRIREADLTDWERQLPEAA